ncbi:MAG: carboxymuconolactone decarboxylase family protein [Erythrobacter sp.]|uniref:carboxymuconolactone decarboxylase family protein n=1 Tax=Erythrobacter sp. TaxID=1042 RepID=UPI0025E57260|nr:carboxymuconolactone decarboxylase family protein [Erythrobacter sp.]MCL9998784.1 carboxymuconolactone decarboxylase family protein [Erythrobacter sp.]
MTDTNPLLANGRLRQNAPKTVAGYRLFRTVIEQDGALPSAIKRFFLAAAACTKGYPEMAERELAAAAAAGLDLEHAASAMTILASSRGEGAAMRFGAVLARCYGSAALVDADTVPIEVAKGEATANFLTYFGQMPPSLGKLMELVPTGADAYYLMREGTLSGTALPPAHAELLLVTVLAADYSEWAAVHMDGARRAGASEAEIAEAVLCAVPVAGLSAWVVGATAMDAGKAG